MLKEKYRKRTNYEKLLVNICIAVNRQPPTKAMMHSYSDYTLLQKINHMLMEHDAVPFDYEELEMELA